MNKEYINGTYIKMSKVPPIQGVTEKNAFILTGNRTHLLQQLF
jgi:hypothetical protein